MSPPVKANPNPRVLVAGVLEDVSTWRPSEMRRPLGVKESSRFLSVHLRGFLCGLHLGRALGHLIFSLIGLKRI